MDIRLVGGDLRTAIIAALIIPAARTAWMRSRHRANAIKQELIDPLNGIQTAIKNIPASVMQDWETRDATRNVGHELARIRELLEARLPDSTIDVDA
ncbi:MAG: hypothetical protein F4Z29_07425 [Gemmatimonadetes bacterium]|nr:hypothetical protein [Gemmatimonadota bacterium]